MRKPVVSRNGLLAALDVGTTKTCCFIARVENGTARLVGVGHQASRGIKAGTVVDLDAAQQAILAAVHTAEQAIDLRLPDRLIVRLGTGAAEKLLPPPPTDHPKPGTPKA